MTLILNNEERAWLEMLLSSWLEIEAWGGNAKVRAEAILAKLKEKGPESSDPEPGCVRCICDACSDFKVVIGSCGTCEEAYERDNPF